MCNLTLQFISDSFNRFNVEYFEGKLNVPTFEIMHTKSVLGQCTWKWNRNYFTGEKTPYAFRIRISNMFNRTEVDYQNTILHEMIHLYIRQNNIKDTNKHHGKVFYSIADRINRQGGWHIARTDSVAGCGLSNRWDKKTFYLAAFKDGNNGKYFIFGMNKNYLEYYKRYFQNYPKHYLDAVVFTSTDDTKYAHFSECRRGIRGYYISKEEYISAKENNNIIFESQTLTVNVDTEAA